MGGGGNSKSARPIVFLFVNCLRFWEKGNGVLNGEGDY